MGRNGNVWEGMDMSIRENNRNGKKYLTGMGMGMTLTGMDRNGKPESHSRTPLVIV